MAEKKENQLDKKSKIEMTYNYKMFKFIKGNRPIVGAKINNLTKSYQSGLNLFPYCPVLVNKDNYVIDGQHRLETCKKLKLPVYYIVIPHVTLLQIAQLNATATRWSINDFFNCFIQTGNTDYNTLRLFKEKYSLSVNMAVQLLMFGTASEGGAGSETFKNGKFEVKHEAAARKIMKAVSDYSEVAEPHALKDRSFIRAVQILLGSTLYKHDVVVEKLKRNKALIQPKSNYKEYIYHVEELYNKNNSKRHFIYQAPITKGDKAK